MPQLACSASLVLTFLHLWFKRDTRLYMFELDSRARQPERLLFFRNEGLNCRTKTHTLPSLLQYFRYAPIARISLCNSFVPIATKGNHPFMRCFEPFAQALHFKAFDGRSDGFLQLPESPANRLHLRF
jgi:hypothetical protein